MTRAVLFDLFHTLVPGGSDGHRHAVTRAMGEVLGVDPEAYARAFHASWPERFAGKLGDLASTVRVIATRVGGAPSDAQVTEAAALRRTMTADLIGLVPAGTLAVLDKLRADSWRVGLVSNTTAESPDRFRESPLAARFDATVFSSELGVAKPDPAIFRAACAALAVDPAACAYVGDGADNELAAASSLGMHAIRTTEHADTDPSWPGPTIHTLTDLPAALARDSDAEN